MSTPADQAPEAPAIPSPPPFDGPLNFSGHLAAIRQYLTWLQDAVANQFPEEGYSIQHVIAEYMQLDEISDALTFVVDKEVKVAEGKYQGSFLQYLHDSKQDNARVQLLGGGSRMLYKQTTTSYTAADALALRSHIIANPNDVDLLQMRLSKPVVEGFAATHGRLPPGVDVFTNVKAHIKK